MYTNVTILIGCGHWDAIVTRTSSVSQYPCLALLNAAWVLKVVEEVHWERSVILNAPLKRLWCYCSIISWKKKSLASWKKLKEGREKQRKESWEISRPISQAPQLPCSSHSPHWLSIAEANLLGEKPHAGKKWNHLDTSTHAYPTAPSFSSSPAHPLFSSLQSPSTWKAWNRNMETRLDASLPPHSSFCAAASLHPLFTSFLSLCQLSSLRERRRGEDMREVSRTRGADHMEALNIYCNAIANHQAAEMWYLEGKHSRSIHVYIHNSCTNLCKRLTVDHFRAQTLDQD